MATSGTFTGARGGNSTGPYLTLSWSRIDTDVANNKSLIRLTLNLTSEYAISFSASKTGVLYGNSFTYSGGFQGPQTKTLKTIDVWVGHNPDGNKSETFSATFNIGITWGGVYVSSISVSGVADIDRIPRASDFSISGNTIGSPITIDITRADASFTHTVIYDLPDGSRRAEWGGIATQHIFTPAMTDSQFITNGGSGTAKITVDTYSGGTLIGTVRKTFTMNVPASVVPTATGLTVAIAGSGRDVTLAKYIQGISKVTANFSAAGAYGSTIVGTIITVKRQSDGADSQGIGGTSGTISNPIGLSGTYLVIGEAWDSRGRYASVSTTITVEAYSPPTITTFTANRSTPSSSVSSTIVASWTALGTSNPTDITVVGVNNVGTSATLYSLADSTAGTLNTTRTFTSQSDASSYTYTLTVTDSFGKEATAVVTIGTTVVELTIAKGKGIGVGKVWEQGALDVKGDTYIDGELNATKGVGPAGVISMFAGSTAPGGYLLCQGQAVSRTTYSRLFGVIGTTYGAGDNSTTFNLPDLRSRVPVGLSVSDVSNFKTLGETGGEKTHALTIGEMPQHSHRMPWRMDGAAGSGAYDVGGGTNYWSTEATEAIGGGGAHNNLQPYLTLNFIIKY